MHRFPLQFCRPFYLYFPIQIARKPTKFQRIVHFGNNLPQVMFISNESLQTNKLEIKHFDSVFADAVKCLTNNFIKPEGEMKSVLLRLKKVLEYNVPDGKKTRGLFVVKAYKSFCNDDFNENDIYLARMLGWCIEMLQAFALILDDIMDQSQTRRGQLCWYKTKDVGMIAINDALWVENCAYLLLKKYIHHKPHYLNIVELFHEVSYQTSAGQSLELMTTSTAGELEFDKFTLDRYNTIVQYKTSYYSFFLPIASALYMAGISDRKIHDKAKEVLLEIGNLFQVQDDYIDCFGDPVITGKVGTDIENGKCTWLVMTALRHADPEEMAVIYKNYGQKKSERIAKVKRLYEKLQLPTVFRKYKKEKYERIISLIDKLEPDLPSVIFRQLVNTVYKRQR